MIPKQFLIALLFRCLDSIEVANAQTNSSCSMCTTRGAALANPDRVVPAMKLRGEDATCQDLNVFASQITDDQQCQLFRAQANFCGCPEESGQPINACSLCSDGSATPVPDHVTPSDNTCGDLDRYLTYQTADECSTERIQAIFQFGWLCQCPNSVTSCSLCPDGSYDMSNAEATIPYFSIPSPNCSQVQDFASLQESSAFDCDRVQAQAGFCGCSGSDSAPLNVCTFCPDGNDPANMDFETPTSDTCSSLNTYVTFMDEEACSSTLYDSIVANAYLCGCKGAKPNCELCVGGKVTNPDYVLTSDGLTCDSLQSIVYALPDASCTTQGDLILSSRPKCCQSGAMIQQQGLSSVLFLVSLTIGMLAYLF